MDFSGKHVFITGGSRGIGRAIATAFAAGGARVAINYLSNTDAAEKTLTSLEGGPHMTVQGDVSDTESVRHMIETVVDDFGALDIVVNNAGIYVYHRLEEVVYDDWQQAWQETLATNLLGPANVAYGAVAPGFVDTELAARVLDGPTGDAIRAQSPLGRVAKPEEVAHAVLFLASEGSEFSTGTIIDVNGASYLRS